MSRYADRIADVRHAEAIARRQALDSLPCERLNSRDHDFAMQLYTDYMQIAEHCDEYAVELEQIDADNARQDAA